MLCSDVPLFFLCVCVCVLYSLHNVQFLCVNKMSDVRASALAIAHGFLINIHPAAANAVSTHTHSTLIII